jgi:hypothetical protein
VVLDDFLSYISLADKLAERIISERLINSGGDGGLGRVSQ